MRIAYVDDTKQRGRREDMGQLVALGAAIFDEAQVQPFAQAFRAVYDEFSVPHDVELKWSNSQRRNWWAESEVRKAIQTPVRRRILELARAHDVRVIVVAWDTNGPASAGGEGPEDAVITFMFERIYLGAHARAEHDRAHRVVRRIFAHLADRGDEPDAIVAFVAGMTDRFALHYAETML